MREWKYRHESEGECSDGKCRNGNIGTVTAGVENAGVTAMERQSNTKGSSTTRRQLSVFTNVATFVQGC